LTTVELDVVHLADGCFCLGLLREAHEAKATASSGVTVLDHDCFLDLSEFLELRAKGLVVSVPCQATDKEL